MSRDLISDIKQMHIHYKMNEAFANLDADKLLPLLKFRVAFLQEELDEMNLAIEERNADDVCDAVIDLVVVALGTLDAFGIDAYKAWDRVLKANMSKTAGTNASRPNEFNLPDLCKPTSFVAPSHADNVGRLAEIF